MKKNKSLVPYAAEFTGMVVGKLLGSGARRVSLTVSDKVTVAASRVSIAVYARKKGAKKRSKTGIRRFEQDTRSVSVVVRVGRPNYVDRRRIAALKRARRPVAGEFFVTNLAAKK